jgi:hypothetical protein
MGKNPTVSVIIPTYNRAHLFGLFRCSHCHGINSSNPFRPIFFLFREAFSPDEARQGIWKNLPRFCHNGGLVFFASGLNLIVLVSLAAVIYFALLYLLKVFDSINRRIIDDIILGICNKTIININ